MRFGPQSWWFQWTALLCAALLVPGDFRLMAQEQAPAPTAAPASDAPKVKTPDQLDSLVAPIALYPDPLLAQVLAASTYPLEIVQAARWVKANPKLTGEALTKASAKQPWDASVQALVAFPDALNLLDTNIQWTQDLGNAFLEQQPEVMDAVQRMRKKAKDAGKLDSSKEQKVEVKTVETKTVIVIEPSNPEVIYVPTYNPVVVYGAAPVYAYPPVVYPWGAVAATAAISFGVGVAMGAMWGGCCGGGYGWGCGWGNNNITINNNFNSRYNYNSGNRTNVGNGNWQHNPEHRRSVPYQNRDTAQKFGGTSRDNAGRSDRGPQASTREAGGNRGQGSDRDPGGNRGPQASTRDAGGNRGQASDRSGGGQDRMGNRSIDSGSRGNNSALSGGSRSQSQANSNRGYSSSRQSSGGGFSGGGARSSGGGARSGGGRRR
jgi:uncharacterized membrane protein YgcG